jgi:hypothetical protein
MIVGKKSFLRNNKSEQFNQLVAQHYRASARKVKTLQSIVHWTGNHCYNASNGSDIHRTNPTKMPFE